MNVRRSAATASMLLVLLVLTACGDDGSPTVTGTTAVGGGTPGSDKCTRSGVTLTPATGVEVAGSPTFAKIKSAGTVVVGVKIDQPNLGYKDTQNTRCGFDIEIAQLVASQLGVDPAKIQYKEIPSANRETAIKGGEVDYYVGTYSITDKRKADVSFSGPYYIAGQDLLVRSDDNSITGKESLKGKRVCSATGSTPLQRVRDENLTDPDKISEFKTYSECVSQLLDNQTDAVTTDDAILKGYAAQAPTRLKVVGKPFSEEKYGIGLPHDDAALRNKIDDILAASYADGTWQKIYDGTLGKSGAPASPPPLERY
ncbi:MAG: glutamate transport system substrate-binding protein [Actinomycetota bacterium]|jgi:glutamate transport system substrate-binding protein|nr:glutamate transport system substrate-binding protein [Actinomycetota bacterium]MEA2843496.1 glutamate transport system substrate-binding protein [Actinomycetota bacterium]